MSDSAIIPIHFISFLYVTTVLINACVNDVSYNKKTKAQCALA